MDVKAAWGLLKDTFAQFNEDKAPRLAAALAYYTIFSIAPLLIVVIAIVGFVFGRQATEGRIVSQIQGMVGPDSARLIQGLVQNASRGSSGIIATAIGIVTTLLGASGLFGQLKDALDTIWEVAPQGNRGILATLRGNLLSFTMVLGIGFLLLVSLILSAAIAALSQIIGAGLPGGAAVWQVIDFVLSLVVIALLFAMIFKILPNVEIAWKDVRVGAIVTALLFTIGKFLIGLYIGKTSAGSAYGAAGSLVIILLWIYYSSMILLFGAEFTQVYANHYGIQFTPKEGYMLLSPQARMQQGISHPEDVEAETKPAEHPSPAVQGLTISNAALSRKVDSLQRQRLTTAIAGAIVGAVGMIVLVLGGLALAVRRALRRIRLPGPPTAHVS